MGQPVRIVSRRRISPEKVQYELDRSLTGTSHEVYSRPDAVTGTRPCDVLASRLFDLDTVEGVHIHSNVLIVTGSTESSESLELIIRDLYIHYLPGVKPTEVEA